MVDAITQCMFAENFCIRFEHTDGHYKFWEAKAFPSGSVRIRYGRIGDWGQVIIKDRAYFERTAPKKIAKGYVVKEMTL